MKRIEKNWSCVSQCGACCRLAPEERVEAISRLNSRQLQKYLSMVGSDGWCVHFDSGSRQCKIYEDRPDFCRVVNLTKLFDVEEHEFSAFAIKCCQQQIKSVYGARSSEIRIYEKKLRRAS